eukprot:CAMPEP_0195529140 /NCGR_PEP_ID=MMETSP0794_2-20130614/31569_1 /TAXON_ID=515487 /ORGANISM="Stephanopyxis turris, Strain CCMP 815" /LENGTH=312 /DNA_ID=CAMNT_0040660395 /DNA_START=264 /DNA_END=1202 /DNA_ORIENTATION=+
MIFRPTSSFAVKPLSSSSMDNSNDDEKTRLSRGLYRPFLEYAWNKLQSSGLVSPTINEEVPLELQSNKSPAKGPFPPGSNVNVEVGAMKGNSEKTVRMARYALLETTGPSQQNEDEGNGDSILPGIHVLNFVIFPLVESQRNTVSMDLPIFGADLVSLPGNKHLIAIDFQPATMQGLQLSPDFEKRLQALHSNYSKTLLWGGDIPEAAQRFFSPYALWTRLNGEDAVDVLESSVMNVFSDYFDLYLDLLLQVDKEQDARHDDSLVDEVKQGHLDYLAYRKANDPARPMLKRLYGEEWTERLIEEVLFPNEGI